MGSAHSIGGSSKQECHPVSDAEHPSSENGSTLVIQPRQPHREIAELLATAIARSRMRDHCNGAATQSEVSLGFSGNQRVNTNPS